MMCTAAREVLKSKSWRGRRSGETIGYHRQLQEAHILATYYLENMLGDGMENYIDFLHPGNVEVGLMVDSFLSAHPDERDKDVEHNILQSLYGNAFGATNINGVEAISQTKALSKWDMWYELQESQLVNWAGDPRTLDNPPRLERICPSEDSVDFAPFTVWRMGPFRKQGPVLMSLSITLKGKSYREFVDRDRNFWIDGPERLLSRLEYTYVPRVHKKERPFWEKQLCKFKKYMSTGQSYDVVLLGAKFADEVRVTQKSGVTKAMLQLESKDIGVRYITDDPDFTMTLEYVNTRRTKDKQNMVVGES